MAAANRVFAFFDAVALAVVAVPVTVLLHELGHFGAAVALGFKEPRLHPFYTEYTQGDYSDSHRLVVTAAGFLVTTLLTVGAGTIALRRPRTFLLALCLAAPIRGLVWVPILILVSQGRATIGGGDEVKLARLTGMPLGAVIGFGFFLVLFAIGATVAGLRRREAAERSHTLLGLFLGLIIGWIAYGAIAPRLF